MLMKKQQITMLIHKDYIILTTKDNSISKIYHDSNLAHIHMLMNFKN